MTLFYRLLLAICDGCLFLLIQKLPNSKACHGVNKSRVSIAISIITNKLDSH